MRTLIMIINQLRNSGPNRVMLDIAANIDRAKIRPVVISLMPDDTVRPIAHKFKEIGVEIYRFNYNFYSLELNTFNVAKRLEKFIVENYDNPVVQAHGYHPTLLTARMHIPHTVTIHCISKEDFIKSRGPIIGNYMVYRFARNLKKQKYPVVISSYMANYYRNICKNNIQLIYNGVSYSPLQSDISQLKQKLAISPNKKIIIVTGGLNERKNNIHTILQLKQSGLDNFLCVFLGIGPQEQFLKDSVGNDNRFRFDGYRTNINEYLAIADLYVSSSLSEGLPLAVLEAVCSGVPCLLSNIPPHKEIVEKIDCQGVDTFSISTNELAENLSFFLNHKWSRRNISERARNVFSSKKMGAQYTELVEYIR